MGSLAHVRALGTTEQVLAALRRFDERDDAIDRLMARIALDRDRLLRVTSVEPESRR